jgi:hypothetical protein
MTRAAGVGDAGMAYSESSSDDLATGLKPLAGFAVMSDLGVLGGLGTRTVAGVIAIFGIMIAF